MAQYTLADINTFPVSADGFRICPAGDYSLITAFPTTGIVKFRFADSSESYTFADGVSFSSPWHAVDLLVPCTFLNGVFYGSISGSGGTFTNCTTYGAIDVSGGTFTNCTIGNLNNPTNKIIRNSVINYSVAKTLQGSDVNQTVSPFVNCTFNITDVLTINYQIIFTGCTFNVANKIAMNIPYYPGRHSMFNKCRFSGVGEITTAAGGASWASVTINDSYFAVNSLNLPGGSVSFYRSIIAENVVKTGSGSVYANKSLTFANINFISPRNLMYGKNFTLTSATAGESVTPTCNVTAASVFGTRLYSTMPNVPTGVPLGRVHITRM